MKKLLVVHNKYQIPGGEDSNIHDEISHLTKEYDVRYLEFNNIEKFRIFDLLSLATRTNLISNKLLKKELNTFKPDAVYIHNTWFKANLGLFKILKKEISIPYLKFIIFDMIVLDFFLPKTIFEVANFATHVFSEKKNRIFNKYYEDSYLKSLLLIFYSKSFSK